MLGLGLGLFPVARGSSAAPAPAFTPDAIFASSEFGDWADFRSNAGMYQDAGQTVPVTADGDVIGSYVGRRGNVLSEANTALKAVWSLGGMSSTDGTVKQLINTAITGSPLGSEITTYCVAKKTGTTFLPNESFASCFVRSGASVNVDFRQQTQRFLAGGGTSDVARTSDLSDEEVAFAAVSFNALNDATFTAIATKSPDSELTYTASFHVDKQIDQLRITVDGDAATSSATVIGFLSINRKLTAAEISDLNTYFGVAI